ncbi:MAG: methylated-DNA--[protein]-cysteine S-methyltransferase [Anaerolineae bacterium]|nr:methylated-DNA--[protein]-cysteine S-methyltransferase [Anaerolineae bacterium]
MAVEVGLSPFHFQRVFRRWAGISPKRFLQFLTKEHAKALLAQSKDLLDVAYEAGLSSPGRLHDLFVTCEAVTPGEFKSRGEGLSIVYGYHPTPFGECLLGLTTRGICWLSFVVGGDRGRSLTALRHCWERAGICLDESATQPLVERIFGAWEGAGAPLPLLLRGTNFQIKVWEALLRIPGGCVASYHDVARWIGAPAAARAVGRAVGGNPIAYIIPCHRVIRRVGAFGQYRWGEPRKLAMLGWEAARRELGSEPVRCL